MPIREIDVEELHRARTANEPVTIVDVRNEGEHALVHLEPCTLIPLHELAGRVDELDELRNARVVVLCHHGVRSRTGAAILEAAGFRDVVSLRGGIDAWSLRIDPRVLRY